MVAEAARANMNTAKMRMDFTSSALHGSRTEHAELQTQPAVQT
jgi:hypothetical protein